MQAPEKNLAFDLLRVTESAALSAARWLGKGAKEEGDGAAVDAMRWNEVVGCIAGDDTIMCAIRTVEDTAAVMEKIRKIVAKGV